MIKRILIQPHVKKLFIIGGLWMMGITTVFGQSGTQSRGLIIRNDVRNIGNLDFYDSSYAVIVGIDDYKDPSITDLNYASADAISIRELLISKFNYKEQNIRLFLNEEATRSNIMSALSSLNDIERNSQVLFYFAGHGETMSLSNGGEMGVLLTYDTFTNNLFATGLRMKELSVVSYLIAAKHQLFMVDACYGGLAAVSTRSLSRQTQRYLSHLLSADARQIITAGGKDEKVIAKAIWGHSAFAKVLLDALGKELGDMDRNGLITAQELAAYMKPRVFAISDGAQQPVYRKFTAGEGDFIFVLEDFATVSQTASSSSGPASTMGSPFRNENPIPAERPDVYNARNSISLTKSYLGRGSFERALSESERIIKNQPYNPLGYYYKGMALSEIADTKEASARQKYYKNMSEAFARAKETARRTGNTSGELEGIDDFLYNLWRTEHNVGIELAENEEIKKNIANPMMKAVAHLKNAIAIMPDSALSWQVLASIQQMNQNFEGAAKAQEQYMALASYMEITVNDHMRLASYYYQQEKHQKVVEALENARKQYPANKKIISNLADSYVRAGESDKAIATVELLVERNPENSQYHLVLATLLYRTALQLSESESINQEQRQHINGYIHYAIDELNTAIKYRPDNDVAYNTLGIVYQNKAADLFEKRDRTANDQKAEQFDRQGEQILLKSMGYYEKAAEINPRNRAYWRSLYAIYNALDMADKAEEAKRKAGL